MKAAAVAAANSRLLNSEVEHRRARARSMITHVGSSTAAAAKPAVTIGSLQPLSPPRETPSTSPVRPTINVRFPSTS